MNTQLDIFHNTLDLPEPQMIERAKKAGSQNALILDLFRANPDKSFTPCEVHNMIGVGKWNTPLTSIRRALTTLTKLSYLCKTSEKRQGWYGMENHTWKLITLEI